jgi:hypothetical protein
MSKCKHFLGHSVWLFECILLAFHSPCYFLIYVTHLARYFSRSPSRIILTDKIIGIRLYSCDCGACGPYGGGERGAQGVGGETRDNIKMYLQEVGGVVGTGWSWLRIGTGGVYLWVRQRTFGFQQNAVNFLTSCKLVSFSRRTLLHGVSKCPYIACFVVVVVYTFRSVHYDSFTTVYTNKCTQFVRITETL